MQNGYFFNKSLLIPLDFAFYTTYSTDLQDSRVHCRSYSLKTAGLIQHSIRTVHKTLHNENPFTSDLRLLFNKN